MLVRRAFHVLDGVTGSTVGGCCDDWATSLNPLLLASWWEGVWVVWLCGGWPLAHCDVPLAGFGEVGHSTLVVRDESPYSD